MTPSVRITIPLCFQCRPQSQYEDAEIGVLAFHPGYLAVHVLNVHLSPPDPCDDDHSVLT